MTTTSYYVQSLDTKKYFYTDDVVVPTEDQPEAEEAMVHLPVADAAPCPVWEEGIPRRRLREKTAPPQLSMFHMEGENCRWVQTWLGAHHERFDVLGPTDHTLCTLEVSSASWSLEDIFEWR